MAVSISISIAQNSQNVTNNTSNVTAKVTAKWTYGSWNEYNKPGWLKIDGVTYNFTSPFNASGTTNGSQTLFTKTVDVAHAADGSKTLSCSASYTSGVSSGTVTASASKTLTTIPRASTMSVKSGTIALGTAMTLLITRQSTNFTHTITYECGSASGTVCTKSTSESISFTPPLTLASQNTTGTSVSLKYTVTTYNGDTSVGTKTYSQTVSIPSSVVPTCNVSISDPTGYSTTYGGYIQGLSKFQVSVTGTQAYSSPIASYSTSANGSTYTSSSFTTGVITNSGTATITGSVKDKRGRTGSKSVTATVLAYSSPKITSLSVNRCNADGSENINGNYVKLTYSCTATSLNSKNNLSTNIRYKKTSDTSYTSKADITASTTVSYTNRSVIVAAESGSSYDVEVSVTDNFTTVAKATSVSTAFAFMHFKGENSMGLGKIAELNSGLDIGFKTRLAGGLQYPVLPVETDLNAVRTPNFYIGANVTTYNYNNCPLTEGTFYLEVVSMGVDGQVRQTITSCDKIASKSYERTYYLDTWGDWKPAVSAAIPVTATGTDLNNYIYNGIYYFDSDHKPGNIPTAYYQNTGVLVVMGIGSSSTKQLWFNIAHQKHEIYHRAWDGSTWSKWYTYDRSPVKLYSGNSDGTISLTNSVANYKYLDIYFTDNNGAGCGHVRLYDPKDGAVVHLSLVEPSSATTIYTRHTKYTFNTNSTMLPNAASAGYIKYTINGSSVSTSASIGTNYLRIIRVEGVGDSDSAI